MEPTPLTSWRTGRFDRAGLARYVHLVRAADDPAETAARGHGRRGTSSRDPGGLARVPIGVWRQRVCDELGAGPPPTFNALAVALTGRTADALLDSHLDRALWDLVDDRLIEHTLAAPIRFRLRGERVGIFGRRVNPALPRWSAPGVADPRCDRCRVETVPDWDAVLCPYPDCCWDLQLCEACGGLARAKEIVLRHTDECAIARASDREIDPDELTTRAAPPQLPLF